MTDRMRATADGSDDPLPYLGGLTGEEFQSDSLRDPSQARLSDSERDELLSRFADLLALLRRPPTSTGQDTHALAHDSERDLLLGMLLPEDSSAHAIKDHLDELVIGQESAKIALSVLFSLHLRWFTNRRKLHKAPNALLIGPTGVGKTHTLKTAATYLSLPFVVVDATALVPSGAQHGQQVEEVLAELVIAADALLRETDAERFRGDDISLAERGVIFIDEFDKLSDEFGSESSLSAWNRTTQRRLLKLTEGSVMSVDTMYDGIWTRRAIDTSGMLFIAGGAFEGIDTQRIKAARGDSVTRALRPGTGVIAQDVVNYGFIPELVARLPIIVSFTSLDARTLLRILRSREVTPLGVWRNHFAQLGKTLVVEPQAEVEIAKRAAALQMGARGLQQTIFPLLASYAYEFEASRESLLSITEDIVTGRGEH